MNDTMTLKDCHEIGKLMREIKSNNRFIQRYTEENVEYLAKLGKILGRTVSLADVLDATADTNEW